jgi:hypothetical protein
VPLNLHVVAYRPVDIIAKWRIGPLPVTSHGPMLLALPERIQGQSHGSCRLYPHANSTASKAGRVFLSVGEGRGLAKAHYPALLLTRG